MDQFFKKKQLDHGGGMESKGESGEKKNWICQGKKTEQTKGIHDRGNHTMEHERKYVETNMIEYVVSKLDSVVNWARRGSLKKRK